MRNFIIQLINRRPILLVISLGLVAYLSAFCISVFAMVSSVTPVFEVCLLLAGFIIMGYHWTMSRYIDESTLAQFIHLCFGLALVTASIALVGATTHVKTYDWLAQLLFL